MRVRARKQKGNVPFTWARSIPFSAAIFFARGLTRTLPFGGGGPAVATAGLGGTAGWGGGAAAGVAVTFTEESKPLASGSFSKSFEGTVRERGHLTTS